MTHTPEDLTKLADRVKEYANGGHDIELIFSISRLLGAVEIALRSLAAAQSTSDDLTWFWEIVDGAGLESVPSDERDALSRIMGELRRLRAAQSGEPVALTYTNYRGETAVRTIIPKSIRYGSTEWHPEPQWLLLALDVEKNADREFALKDFGIHAVSGAKQMREACARLLEQRARHMEPGGIMRAAYLTASQEIRALPLPPAPNQVTVHDSSGSVFKDLNISAAPERAKPSVVRPYTNMPGAMIGGETTMDYLMSDGTVECLTTSEAIARKAPTKSDGTFQCGDHVEKISGAKWRGVIVGEYSTSLTPEGYAVESDTEIGSVQIYPAKALRLVSKSDGAGMRREKECDLCHVEYQQGPDTSSTTGTANAGSQGEVAGAASVANQVVSPDRPSRETARPSDTFPALKRAFDIFMDAFDPAYVGERDDNDALGVGIQAGLKAVLATAPALDRETFAKTICDGMSNGNIQWDDANETLRADCLGTADSILALQSQAQVK